MTCLRLVLECFFPFIWKRISADCSGNMLHVNIPAQKDAGRSSGIGSPALLLPAPHWGCRQGAEVSPRCQGQVWPQGAPEREQREHQETRQANLDSPTGRSSTLARALSCPSSKVLKRRKNFCLPLPLWFRSGCLSQNVHFLSFPSCLSELHLPHLSTPALRGACAVRVAQCG